MEFVMRVRPYYNEETLKQKSYFTFLDILDECTIEERQRLDQMSNLTGH
jgi:hypothetical protein